MLVSSLLILFYVSVEQLCTCWWESRTGFVNLITEVAGPGVWFEKHLEIPIVHDMSRCLVPEVLFSCYFMIRRAELFEAAQYLYLTSVEFKLLAHTEEGSLKSNGVFSPFRAAWPLFLFGEFCMSSIWTEGQMWSCRAAFSEELTDQGGSGRCQHEPQCRHEGPLRVFRTAPVPALISPVLSKDSSKEKLFLQVLTAEFHWWID